MQGNFLLDVYVPLKTGLTVKVHKHLKQLTYNETCYERPPVMLGQFQVSLPQVLLYMLCLTTKGKPVKKLSQKSAYREVFHDWCCP